MRKLEKAAEIHLEHLRKVRGAEALEAEMSSLDNRLETLAIETRSTKGQMVSQMIKKAREAKNHELFIELMAWMAWRTKKKNS